jgi:hypothetical protein
LQTWYSKYSCLAICMMCYYYLFHLQWCVFHVAFKITIWLTVSRKNRLCKAPRQLDCLKIWKSFYTMFMLFMHRDWSVKYFGFRLCASQSTENHGLSMICSRRINWNRKLQKIEDGLSIVKVFLLPVVSSCSLWKCGNVLHGVPGYP